jgi:hypothetical protein
MIHSTCLDKTTKGNKCCGNHPPSLERFISHQCKNMGHWYGICGNPTQQDHTFTQLALEESVAWVEGTQLDVLVQTNMSIKFE